MHFERGDDDLRLLTAMPKPELHLHLDGSLDPALALELAASRGVDAPRDWAGMRAALVAPERCLDQADLLRAFDLPIALLQDAEALHRASETLMRAKAAEGVAYAELRWGPALHTMKGLSLREVISAVAAGAAAAHAATGIEVRLIVTALRSHGVDENRALATAAAGVGVWVDRNASIRSCLRAARNVAEQAPRNEPAVEPALGESNLGVESIETPGHQRVGERTGEGVDGEGPPGGALGRQRGVRTAEVETPVVTVVVALFLTNQSQLTVERPRLAKKKDTLIVKQG